MKRVKREQLQEPITVSELTAYIKRQLNQLPEGEMVKGVNLKLDADRLHITLKMDPKWYKGDYSNVLRLGIDIGDESGSHLIKYDMYEVWRILEEDLYYIAEVAESNM